MHAVKEGNKATISNMQTCDVDNRVHPVWAMSLGPVSKWGRPLHIVLEMGRCTWMMFSVIQGCALNMSGLSLHEMFRYKNSHSQWTSYQHDTISHEAKTKIPQHASSKDLEIIIHLTAKRGT